MMRVIKSALPLLGISTALLSAASGSDMQQGMEAFKAGRYSAALPAFGRALKAHSDPNAELYLALTQAATNDCGPALPVLDRSLADSDAERSRISALAAARCHSSEGDNARAAAILSVAEKRFPNDADVLYLQAKTEMNAFNEATFAMFQRTPASYRVHLLSAEILEVQNRYGDAIAEYRKALALNGSAPELHYGLGRALLLQSHSAEALQEAADAFRAELAVNPEDSASEFQLGQIAQVEGNGAQARAHYETALRFTPRFANAAISLGKLYAQEKLYDQAIELLKQAIALQPANEGAHYALLTAYRNAGQTDKARAEKSVLDKLQKPPDGEFSNFLKKLGDQPPMQQ